MPATLIAVALGWLLLSAIVNAAEAALFSLQSEQIESLERRGHHGVFAARGLLAFHDETLTTLLIAERAANLLATVCVLFAFLRLAPGQPLIGAALATVVSAGAILLFARLLPRVIGRCHNEQVAMLTARAVVGLTVLLAPVRWTATFLASLFLRGPREAGERIGSLPHGWATARGPREAGEWSAAVAEDARGAAPSREASAGLEDQEAELITSVVEFSTLFAGEIVTPRPEIVAFSDALPQDELLRQMQRCKFGRVLVYSETLDQIVGLLHLKDVLLNPETDYHELLRKPLVVPENKRLPDLLREFRRRRVHLAVVCDEFGRTAGVVTLQDLLEEIVGEIFDENRRSPQTIRPLGNDAWLVLGRTPVAELRTAIGLPLSEEMGRTVAGFFANRLGRIPALGDSTEEGGFRFTVERMAVRRATVLRIERLAEESGDAETAV